MSQHICHICGRKFNKQRTLNKHKNKFHKKTISRTSRQGRKSNSNAVRSLRAKQQVTPKPPAKTSTERCRKHRGPKAQKPPAKTSTERWRKHHGPKQQKPAAQTNTKRSHLFRANETPTQIEKRLEKDRDRYHKNQEKYTAARRKRYDEKNMDLFIEQRERAAKAFIQYPNHPFFDEKSFNTGMRKTIADIVNKKPDEVENSDVWGIQELFQEYGQTCYKVKKDGTIDKSVILESGKTNYIDAMMTEWYSQIGRVEMRTCSKCFERWFHFRGKKETPDTKPCYIEPLEPRHTEQNNYQPTQQEHNELLKEWYALYPNTSKIPSDRVLMIANLVKLNRESTHP